MIKIKKKSRLTFRDRKETNPIFRVKLREKKKKNKASRTKHMTINKRTNTQQNYIKARGKKPAFDLLFYLFYDLLVER